MYYPVAVFFLIFQVCHMCNNDRYYNNIIDFQQWPSHSELELEGASDSSSSSSLLQQSSVQDGVESELLDTMMASFSFSSEINQEFFRNPGNSSLSFIYTNV